MRLMGSKYAERRRRNDVHESDRHTTTDPILSVEGIIKQFNGITALDNMDLNVSPNTITGLIGPNGAGKSTLFNVITGTIPADSGTIRFRNENITDSKPYQVADLGLVRTFQTARELTGMTLLENMMLAAPNQLGEQIGRSIIPGLRNRVGEQEKAILERVWEILELFELDHLAYHYASDLSGGQRKLLEMARVLMTNPEMILLDEPFAGINPTLEDKLLDRIHKLRDQGYTFLLVEHDVDLVLKNCEPIIVMHQGKVLDEGTVTDIRNNAEVIEAYLGGGI